MIIDSLNKQLREVYQPYLNSLYAQSWENNVSAPLLMQVFPEYAELKRKVMFVGQETHSWGAINHKLTTEQLQTVYKNFDLGKSADYGDGKPLRYLKSPFWNFSRSFFHIVNATDPKVSRKTSGFLWTNISKFDCNSTTPDHELQLRNEAGFHLLKTEIAILKPDVVVFLTGTKYDSWIDKVFSPDRQEILPDGFLKKLIVCDGCLPALSFQTKHPRTLIGSKKSNIANRYRDVISSMAELVLVH